MTAHVQKSVSELPEMQFACQPLWSTGTKAGFKSTLSSEVWSRKQMCSHQWGVQWRSREMNITSLSSFRLKLKLKRGRGPLAHFLRRADLVPKEGSRAFWGTAEEQLLPLSLLFAFRFSKNLTQWYKPFSKRHVRITGNPLQQHYWLWLEMSILIVTASQGSTNEMHLSQFFSLVAPVSFIFRVDTISTTYLTQAEKTKTT